MTKIRIAALLFTVAALAASASPALAGSRRVVTECTGKSGQTITHWTLTGYVNGVPQYSGSQITCP